MNIPKLMCCGFIIDLVGIYAKELEYGKVHAEECKTGYLMNRIKEAGY